MQRYVHSGESFYSVPEACQDRYLDLLIAEAVQTGQSIEATPITGDASLGDRLERIAYNALPAAIADGDAHFDRISTNIGRFSTLPRGTSP